MMGIILPFTNIQTTSAAPTYSDSYTREFTTAYFPQSLAFDPYHGYLLGDANGFKLKVKYRAVYEGSTTNAKINFEEITVYSAHNDFPDYKSADLRIAINYQKPNNDYIFGEEITENMIYVPYVDDTDDWARYIGWRSETVVSGAGYTTANELKGSTTFTFSLTWNDLSINIQISTAHFTMYLWSIYNYEDIVYVDHSTNKYYGKINFENTYDYFGYATHQFTIPPYPSGGGGGGGGWE